MSLPARPEVIPGDRRVRDLRFAMDGVGGFGDVDGLGEAVVGDGRDAMMVRW